MSFKRGTGLLLKILESYGKNWDATECEADYYDIIRQEKSAFIEDNIEMRLIRCVYQLYAIKVKQDGEIEELNNVINRLYEERTLIRRTSGVKNGRVSIQMVQQGAKPAFKPQANISRIRELEQLGHSDDDIARMLKVSKSTLWRRRKEAGR